jgi:imidazolonepropionase-like amidohydrolase
MIYVRDVSVFDGHTLQEHRGVLIDGARISWVGAHEQAPPEARGAREQEGAGATLVPGLIDCHVHLTFDGSPDFAAEAAELTPTLAAVKALRNAAEHLASGVTTVRDLGAPGAVVAEIGRAIAAGLVAGPRVVAAGTALTITGGHGHNVAFAREVDGPDDVRKAVREEIRAGATAIKIVATGGVLTPGIGADFTAFTPEELAAAVDEAHKWGRPIGAHATGEGGIRQSVDAGVDSIEHGSMISAEVAERMVAAGTVHVPTINAIRGIVDHPDEVPDYAVEKGRALEPVARESFLRAATAGVVQASGTDAGTPFNPHGSLPLELVRMVQWGITPIQALRAATVNAAALLRVDGEVGSIEVGKQADLVLVAGDPAADIARILDPKLVLRAGEVVAGTPP